MRLLLDTHIVIWALGNRRRLPREAVRLIDRADAVHVSAVSLWEMAIKSAASKLSEIDMTAVDDGLAAANAIQLPVTWEHARRYLDIADGHPDPFDRMLLAQAVVEPLHFLTADEALAQYTDLVIAV